MAVPDLATTPAMAPPPGVVPDFTGGSSLQRSLIIVYAVTFAFATVTLALRLFTRVVIVRGLGLDEPIIVLSWGVSLAFFIVMVLAMPAGFGKHMWDVSLAQIQGYLNLLLVLALTYIWPPSLTKLAILVLYHRINPSRQFRIACYCTGVFVFSYTVVFTALFAGPCNPQSQGSGTCLNNIAAAQAILNIISDAVLIALPIPMIHGLNMPIRQKFIVGLILALGSGATIASIARLAYVKKMQDNPDITWTQASAAVLSSVELNLGIICNCSALLKPFARRYFGWISSTNGTNEEGPSYAKPRSGIGMWRADPVKHSYQLHSYDRGNGNSGRDHREKEDDAGIVRVDEYSVQFDGKTSKVPSDDGSTENILMGNGSRNGPMNYRSK